MIDEVLRSYPAPDKFQELLRRMNEYFEETMQMLEGVDRHREGSIVVSVPQDIVEKVRQHEA